MGLRQWNLGVLGAVMLLLAAGGTQREKPVLSSGEASDALRGLEADVRARPGDTAAAARLAQGYVDAHVPGLAVSLLEHPSARSSADARALHVYARALLDSGRAAGALAVERRVLTACAELPASCDTWLLVGATRRVDILRELVELGVEDAAAHPEYAAVAYHKATREARLAQR